MIHHSTSCPSSVCSVMGDSTGPRLILSPPFLFSSDALDLWPVLPYICVLCGCVWLSIW